MPRRDDDPDHRASHEPGDGDLAHDHGEELRPQDCGGRAERGQAESRGADRLSRNGSRAMMLSASDIHVSYGMIAAVKGVSIEIGDGEIVALIGPNGAGKSTLLKAIAGLLPIQRGAFAFSARNIATGPGGGVRRPGLGLGRKAPPTLKQMRVRETLVLGPYARHDHALIGKDMDQ